MLYQYTAPDGRTLDGQTSVPSTEEAFLNTSGYQIRLVRIFGQRTEVVDSLLPWPLRLFTGAPENKIMTITKGTPWTAGSLQVKAINRYLVRLSVNTVRYQAGLKCCVCQNAEPENDIKVCEANGDLQINGKKCCPAVKSSLIISATMPNAQQQSD